MNKHRVFVLTDIENEPDDAMSMVRFLTYANHFDIEGLVATTSIHLKDRTAAWRIRDIVGAYTEVRDNLEKHEAGYPEGEALMALVKEGLPLYGMEGVGEGKDSEGSELLIRALDRKDERPLWVLVWGGPSVLAQALWKIRNERSPEELDAAVKKLRVYTISDQDDSAPWMRKTFPELFYIASPGFHAGGAYHMATWSGISGDRFHGRFPGADFSIVDNPWLAEHIQSKGPLGKQYPSSKFLMEGDTPTFLYLINNGLGDSEHPEWGSWGGRYEYYLPPTKKWFAEPETRALYSDAEDEVMGVDGQWYTTNKASIWRWREAFQNDFAARMDWTVKSAEEANHPPVPVLDHPAHLEARPGETVELSASGSWDPDGDDLSFNWFYYGEAGTFSVSKALTGNPIDIEDADKPGARFTVPTERVFRNGTIHIILALTDSGTPALTRYKRVIIDIK
ncbi:MAG: DUF1593 domain-containing protein [Spirochaetales bacterium]|nr:DUF1593 domain-containing protein [Spirochaetales bacterium]